jgi:hypothetical protein
VGAGVAAGDLALLERVQDTLGRQRDAQVLLDRVRESERAFGKPSLSAWRDTDAVIALLDTRCRRLHARFMRLRPALVSVAERLAGTHAATAARRKVG